MATHLTFGGAELPVEGRWGGERLNLVIEGGEGRLESDCASGRISGPIKLSVEGRYAGAGTFSEHKAGPQQADAPSAPAAARYTIEVAEGVMTLTVLPAATTTPIAYRLRRGASVKLVRCL